MKLWVVSMECAGIAEAGGVKNVTFSLCKEFSKLGHEVTLFIPVFKCNSWALLKNVKTDECQITVSLCGRKENVSFTSAVCTDGNFNVVLINHPSFAEKEGVYTYTENEQNRNPELKKGEGHIDLLFKDILFQKSICGYLNTLSSENRPDIIHCQDASTAMLPAFVRSSGKDLDKIKTVVTIHNAGPFYHHEFKNVDEALWYTELDKSLLEKSLNSGRVEPFLAAIESSANITTVSEVYADELMDPENTEATDGLSMCFYERGVQVKGITNGFDYDRYNPENTAVSKLPFAFSPEKLQLEGKYKSREVFVKEMAGKKEFSATGIRKFGFLDCSENCSEEVFYAYHGRITGQKGISVLIEAISAVISNNSSARFIIAGQGDPVLEEKIKQLARNFAGKVIFMNGYNQSVVRLVTAMSDFIVLPSYFEPCGLEDFIAQAYGTLPVAHKTGGLNKIQDNITGFLYECNSGEVLAGKLLEVAEIKNDTEKLFMMIKAGAESVHGRYYWENVIKNEYLKFFKEILKK